METITRRADQNFVSAVKHQIMQALKVGKLDAFRARLGVAYVLYLKSKHKCSTEEALGFIQEEDVKLYIKEVISNCKAQIKELGDISETEVLVDVVMDFGKNTFDRMDESTPECVSRLALKILDIKDSDYVADFATGTGTFLINAYDENSNAKFYGNDINTMQVVAAKIRLSLLVNKYEIEQGDLIALTYKKKFNKIFSNYPLGMKYHLSGNEILMKETKSIFPNISRVSSYDWVFNYKMIQALKKDGKAIGIMTDGSTWNSMDKPFREYFISNGYIEAVISLPARLFGYMNISTTMIVLSHDNKSIKMIDARGCCHAGRRNNEITDKDIETIYKAYAKDGKISKTISIEELEKQDFAIFPGRYMEEEIHVQNGVEFGSLIKRITRGAQLRAMELDEMASKTKTNCQYLMLANVKNGIIDRDLPYITEIDKNKEKYCIKNHDLIISKIGYPFKVAVAELDKGNKILANGNLYIIELDESKVNPYYIKAYLDSEDGATSLKRIAVGAALPNLSLEPLKKLLIPMKSLEEQKKIVLTYQSKQDEILILKQKLDKAVSDLSTIFSEEG